jgi:hypothetical protein
LAMGRVRIGHKRRHECRPERYYCQRRDQHRVTEFGPAHLNVSRAILR